MPNNYEVKPLTTKSIQINHFLCFDLHLESCQSRLFSDFFPHLKQHTIFSSPVPETRGQAGHSMLVHPNKNTKQKSGNAHLLWNICHKERTRTYCGAWAVWPNPVMNSEGHIIITYIYHALINTLGAHFLHILPFFCFHPGFFVILIMMYAFIVLVLFWLSSRFWCW